MLSEKQKQGSKEYVQSSVFNKGEKSHIHYLPKDTLEGQIRKWLPGKRQDVT